MASLRQNNIRWTIGLVYFILTLDRSALWGIGDMWDKYQDNTAVQYISLLKYYRTMELVNIVFSPLDV